MHAPTLPTPMVSAVRDPSASDRHLFPIDAFARLMLAIREQRSFIEASRQNVTAAAPVFRHHLARAVAGLVDLAPDRSDVLIALAVKAKSSAMGEARAAAVAALS